MAVIQEKNKKVYKVSDILDEMYGPANVRQEEAETPVANRKMREGWLPFLGAGATRIGSGWLGGIVGAVPSIITTPAAAAISGVGEAVAQKIESPDPLNKKLIGTESALGAVPFGKLVRGVKGLAGSALAKQATGNAARLAAYIESGNIMRRMADDPEDKGLGEKFVDALPGMNTTGAFDLATTGLGWYLGKRIPAAYREAAEEVPAVVPVLDKGNTAEGIKADELSSLLSQVDATGAKSTNLVKPTPTLGGSNVVSPAVKQQGLRIGAPEGVKGANKTLPADPIEYAKETRAFHAETAEPLPAEIAEQLRLIDARPPSNRLQLMLDEAGNATTPAAKELQQYELDVKELQKQRILVKHRKEMDALKAKQEAKELAADREDLRNRLGSTDIGKVETAAAKAQAGAHADVVAKEKAHTTAAKMVEDEKRLEAARRAIDEAIEKDELVPNPPIVKESTVGVPTVSGKQTLTQTFTPKKVAEEGDELVRAPRGPLPVGPTGRPTIPATDPDIVSKTLYPDQMSALHDLAGSGQRGQILGKSHEWRVKFDEEPKAPVAETPKASAAPVTPVAEASVTPDITKNTWSNIADAEGIAASLTESTGKPHQVVPMKDGSFKVTPKPVTPSRVPTKAEGKKSNIPPEPPPAAPVAAKPKPAPKKPSGGASAKPEAPKPEAKPALTPEQRIAAAEAKMKEPVATPAAPKTTEQLLAEVKAKADAGAANLQAKKTALQEAKTPDEIKAALPPGMKPRVPVNVKLAEPTTPVGGPAVKPVQLAQKAPGAPPAPGKPPVAPAPEKSPTAAPKPVPEASKALPEAPKTSGKLNPAERAAVRREDAAEWTTEKLTAVKAAYPKDKRLQTIINDEIKAREVSRRARINQGTPEPSVKIKTEPPTAGEPPRVPINRVFKTRDEALSEAKRLSNELNRVHIISGDNVKGWTVAEMPANTIAGTGARMKVNPDAKPTPAPAKAAETKPANVKPQGKVPAADPVGPTPTRVTVDLSGAKDAKEVKNRVVNEIEKYKAQVQKYEDSRGVDEKGQYTYSEPLPKPLTIEVPNGPTYTFKPDLEQLNNAITRFEKGTTVKGETGITSSKIDPDSAFKGIVDAPEKRPTHVTAKTGYGSNFNAEGGSAPSVKLPIAPIAKKPAQPAIPAKGRPTSGSPEGAAKNAAQGGPKAASRPLGESAKAESKARIAAAGDPADAKARVKQGAADYLKTKTPEEIAAAEARVAEAKARMSQSKPTEGTGKLADLALKEKDAWDKYFDLKQNKGTPEEVRAAGKAAGEIRAELAKAVKEAQAKGEPIPTFLQKQADAPAAKPTTPKGKGLTSEDIAKMPAAQQEETLKKAVEAFKKGRSKRKFDETGAGITELATAFGLSAAGAAIGGTMTPDDPLTGMLIGGGLGFAPVAVYRAVANHIDSLPPKTAEKSKEALGRYVKDKANAFFEVLPDYYRASLLSRPEGLLINSFVGPYGAAMMGAMERAVAGDARGKAAFLDLINPKTFMTEWFSKATRTEAKNLVFSGRERADMIEPKHGPEALQKAIKFPAQMMTTGDVAARKILMKHGFSETEARSLTLTSEPYTKAISDFVRAGEPSEGLVILKRMALPFFRTSLNQVEQSFMRAPVLGFAAERLFKNTPRSLKLQLAQQGIGAGVMGIGYALGAVTPKEQRARYVKLLTNFGGPYGTLIAAGFMAGYKSQTEPDIEEQIKTGLASTINELPLPAGDAIAAAGKASVQTLALPIKLAIQGKITEKDIPDLPFGAIPPVLSSKEAVSIPSAMRDPAGFTSKSFRPTQKEYSLLAPFIQKPELKDLPRSESEVAKADKAKKLQQTDSYRAKKEKRRLKQKEIRNKRRERELNQ